MSFIDHSLGFSLIESIITLIVVGIFASFLRERFFLTLPDDVIQERALMASRLAHARTQGIIRGGSCLVLNAHAIIYGTTDAPMTPPVGEGTSTNLSENVTLSPQGALCFDALGRLCTTGTFNSSNDLLNKITDSTGRKLCTSTNAKTLILGSKTGKVILEINEDGYVAVQ